MSNQYPQTTTHRHGTDLYLVFPSMRKIDSERKGLRVTCAFFKKNYQPDGRVKKTVATAEDLSELWRVEAMNGLPTFVMKSSCK